MSCTIVCGGFWGDEGKGKVVSYLSSTDKPDAAARTGVGPKKKAKNTISDKSPAHLYAKPRNCSLERVY